MKNIINYFRGLMDGDDDDIFRIRILLAWLSIGLAIIVIFDVF